ncbi:MAG TPA: ROK family protein, partial [Anaerolineales bacterium]|nr:ROK family protein [Anaerolineales bacterium]
MHILGIDVGGSGIKGAPVDIETGTLLAERFRIKTPKKAEPEPVAEVVAEIARSFEWQGPIGIGFPAPIKAGVAMMAANISDKWVG